MINDELKIAFLHFPKTRGMWIADMLKSKGFHNINITLNGGHLGVKFVPEGFSSFGFVRHPVDWYQSLFNYLCTVDWKFHPTFRSDNINQFIDKTKLYKFNPLKQDQERNRLVLERMYKSFFGIGTNKECTCIGKHEEMPNALIDILNGLGLDIKDQALINKDIYINRSKKFKDIISGENLEYIFASCDSIFERFRYDKIYP